MDELADLGVATRLYYPALHRQKVFAAFGPHADREYPNSIEFEKTALSLPIFTGLTPDEQDYVSAAVLKVVRKPSPARTRVSPRLGESCLQGPQTRSVRSVA